MDRISELRRRERKLRDKVCQAPVSEFGATPSDQSWVVHHLSEMRMIFERHLAELPVSKRQDEEYRLEFELPLFSHLSRAYELFYPEAGRLDSEAASVR